MSIPGQMLSYTDATTTASGATRTVPTLQSEGMDMSNLNGYRIIVSAALGQLLLGAGYMRAYFWSHTVGGYVRNQDLDFPITPNGGSWVNSRFRGTTEFVVAAPFGEMVWAPDGVTTDGGVITTQIEGSKRNL